VNRLACILVGGAVGTIAISGAPASAQPASSSRVEVESRYQIGQMERLLEGAVEHGVTVLRDRMQTVTQIPMDLMVSDNAHARGFRLEGYGIFFDVIAPSFETSALVWSYNTLNQNDLGVDSAIKKLQAAIKDDPNAQQALQRLLIQVGPGSLRQLANPSTEGAREKTGSAAAAQDRGAGASGVNVDAPQQPTGAIDPILNDPNEVYRTEVIQALEDAMLDHSSGLKIGGAEWLTIAVKGNESRPRLGPADTTGRTVILRLRGADLAAFLTNQIERSDVLKRIEVRVF
jgi:hypothetical protein